MTNNDENDYPPGYANLEEYRANVREADALAFEVSEMFVNRELGVVGICMIRLMAKFILLNPATAPAELMKNFGDAVVAIAQHEREKEALGMTDAPRNLN